MQVAILGERQRGPTPYTRRSAMHRSKLDIEGAEDAAAGGMSTSSGSSASACGGVPSSSSSDSSAIAHTGKPLSRLWRDVLGEEFIAGMECRGLRHGIAEIVVRVGTQPTPTRRPRLVFVAEVRDCASCPFGRRLSSPCLVHDHIVELAVEDVSGLCSAIRPNHEPPRGSAQFAPSPVEWKVNWIGKQAQKNAMGHEGRWGDFGF